MTITQNTGDFYMFNTFIPTYSPAELFGSLSTFTVTSTFTNSNFYISIPIVNYSWTTTTTYTTTDSPSSDYKYVDIVSKVPYQDVIEFDEDADSEIVEALKQLEHEIEIENQQKSIESNYNRAMEILKWM